MSSATFYSTTNDDNGYWNTSGSLISAPADPAFGDVAGVGQHSWILIRNVNIPPSATIESAKITIKAYDNRELTTCNANIFVVVDDDRDLPSSYDDVEGRAVSSPVGWSNIGSFTSGSFYDTVDITSALQELVDLSSWAYGGNALFFIKNNGSSTNAVRYFSSFYTPSNTDNPRLYAEWTPREGYCDIPKLTAYGSASSNSSSGNVVLRIDNDGLGGISCSATSAPHGATTIPSATMSATAKPGNDGVMTFPVATMTGLVGARGEVQLPSTSVSSWTTNPGNGVVAMAQMTMSASVAYANIVAQGVMTMRGVDVSAIGLVGQVASADLGIKISVFASCIQTKHASASARMIPPTVNGIASINLVGEASADMYYPKVTATATSNSSEFTGPVVYDKGAVR